MAGSPRKRARREEARRLARELPKAGRGSLRRDPDWVDRAWVAYREEPTCTGLARRMRASKSTAHRLIVDGAPSSEPFRVRLARATRVLAEKSVAGDAEALNAGIEALGDVVQACAAVTTQLRFEVGCLVDEGADAGALMALVTVRGIAQVTGALAKAIETLMAIRDARGPRTLLDATDGTALPLSGVLTLIGDECRKRLGMKAIRLDE